MDGGFDGSAFICNVSPAGSEPESTDQLYGGMPPVMATDKLPGANVCPTELVAGGAGRTMDPFAGHADGPEGNSPVICGAGIMKTGNAAESVPDVATIVTCVSEVTPAGAV
jgi:hypothetical protein